MSTWNNLPLLKPVLLLQPSIFRSAWAALRIAISFAYAQSAYILNKTHLESQNEIFKQGVNLCPKLPTTTGEHAAIPPLDTVQFHCHLPRRTSVKVARFWPSQKSWRWHITHSYYKLHLISINISSCLLDAPFETTVTVAVIGLISHWMSLLVWIHKPKEHLFGIRKFLKTGWLWAHYIAIIFSDTESICSSLTVLSSIWHKKCLS